MVSGCVADVFAWLAFFAPDDGPRGPPARPAAVPGMKEAEPWPMMLARRLYPPRRPRALRPMTRRPVQTAPWALLIWSARA